MMIGTWYPLSKKMAVLSDILQSILYTFSQPHVNTVRCVLFLH